MKASKRRAYKNGDGPEGVDAYLAACPPKVRALLSKLRKSIKSAAPMAQELISYGIVGYKYQGPLVYFAAHEKHCGFYGVSKSLIKIFEKELKGFKTDTTTIHFWINKPLPAGLVKEMVRRRVEENEMRAVLKKKSA